MPWFTVEALERMVLHTRYNVFADTAEEAEQKCRSGEVEEDIAEQVADPPAEWLKTCLLEVRDFVKDPPGSEDMAQLVKAELGDLSFGIIPIDPGERLPEGYQIRPVTPYPPVAKVSSTAIIGCLLLSLLVELGDLISKGVQFVLKLPSSILAYATSRK